MDVRCEFPSLRAAFWSARAARTGDASAPAAVAGPGSTTEGLLLGSARTVREASERDALAPGALPPPPLAVLAEGWGGPPTPSGGSPGVRWAPPLPPGANARGWTSAAEPPAPATRSKDAGGDAGAGAGGAAAAAAEGPTASSLLPPLSSSHLWDREERIPSSSARFGSVDSIASARPPSTGSSVPPPPSARARSPPAGPDAFDGASGDGGDRVAGSHDGEGARGAGGPFGGEGARGAGGRFGGDEMQGVCDPLGDEGARGGARSLVDRGSQGAAAAGGASGLSFDRGPFPRGADARDVRPGGPAAPSRPSPSPPPPPPRSGSLGGFDVLAPSALPRGLPSAGGDAFALPGALPASLPAGLPSAGAWAARGGEAAFSFSSSSASAPGAPRPPALGIPCGPDAFSAPCFEGDGSSLGVEMRVGAGMGMQPLLQRANHRRCASPPASPTRGSGSGVGSSGLLPAPSLPRASSPRSPSCPPPRASPAPGLTRLDLDVLDRGSGPPPTELRARRDKLALWEGRCSEVAPGVLVGAEAAARDRAALDAAGVTHVLSCVGETFPSHFPEAKSYRVLCLRDAPTEDLLCVLYDALDYVRRALQADGRVLVHCSQGVSRSVSVAVAWRMLRMREGYDAAFAAVKAGRGIANPNIGFVCQLLQWSARRRAGVGKRGGRLYRLAPQGGRAPLHLVPKLVSAGIDEGAEEGEGASAGATEAARGEGIGSASGERGGRGQGGEHAERGERGDAPRAASLGRGSEEGREQGGGGDGERASAPDPSSSPSRAPLSGSPSSPPRAPLSGSPSSPSRASARVGPSSPPLPPVPKLARSLDPRGSFVLHSRRAAVAWVGSRASVAHARAAERAARHLARYEGAGPLEADDQGGLGGEDGGVDARRLLEASGEASSDAGARGAGAGGAGGGLDSPAGGALGPLGLDSPAGVGPLPQSLPFSPQASGASLVPLPAVAPLPVVVVRQGEEPGWFWDALGARDGAQRAAAARAADQPVEAYDDELEAHARALAGARRAGGRAAEGAEDGLGGVDRGLPIDWTLGGNGVWGRPDPPRGSAEGKGAWSGIGAEGEGAWSGNGAEGEGASSSSPAAGSPRRRAGSSPSGSPSAFEPLPTCRGAAVGRAPRWGRDPSPPVGEAAGGGSSAAGAAGAAAGGGGSATGAAGAADSAMESAAPSPASMASLSDPFAEPPSSPRPPSPTREAVRKTPRAAAPAGTPSPNDRQRKLLRAEGEAAKGQGDGRERAGEASAEGAD